MTPHDVTASLFDGLADLPAFNPDDDHDPLPSAVADLRQQIAACVRVPVAHQAVGPDGLVADEGLRTQIGEVLTTIAQHVREAGPS